MSTTTVKTRRTRRTRLPSASSSCSPNLSFSTRRRRFHRRRPWVKKSFFFEEIFESFLDFERWAKHVYTTIMLKVFTINTMMRIPLRVNVVYFHHRENDEVLSSSSLNSHFVFLGSSPSDSSTFAALSSSPLDFAELSSSLDVSNLPSL